MRCLQATASSSPKSSHAHLAGQGLRTIQQGDLGIATFGDDLDVFWGPSFLGDPRSFMSANHGQAQQVRAHPGCSYSWAHRGMVAFA